MSAANSRARKRRNRGGREGGAGRAAGSNSVNLDFEMGWVNRAGDRVAAPAHPAGGARCGIPGALHGDGAGGPVSLPVGGSSCDYRSGKSQLVDVLGRALLRPFMCRRGAELSPEALSPAAVYITSKASTTTQLQQPAGFHVPVTLIVIV